MVLVDQQFKCFLVLQYSNAWTCLTQILFRPPWTTDEPKYIWYLDDVGIWRENDKCVDLKIAVTLVLPCAPPLCQAEDGALDYEP